MNINWTIGRKLGAAFGVVLLIQVIVGGLSYWNTTRLLDDSALVRHTYQVLESINHLLSARQDMETGERGFVLTGEDDFLKPYNNGLTNSAQSFQDLRTLTADNPTQQDRLDNLETMLEQHDAFLERVISTRRQSGEEPARMLITSGEGKQFMDSIRVVLGELDGTEKILLDQRSQSTSAAASQTTWTILLGTGLAIAFVLVAGISISRSISRPLGNVVEQLRALAAGGADLTQRLPATSRDEVGQLAQAFNTFMDTMNEIIGSIVDSAAKLSTGSAEISSSVNQIAAGSESQNQQVVQTSASMEEMTSSIQEVASNAKSTAERSQATVNQAQGSTASVMTVLDALQGTNESLQGLSQRSEEIDKLVNLISEIAGQTNILALNAAIEAAGAGDEGSRFNVVAEEIRKLAGRTTQSTSEISGTVGIIQEEIQTIAKQMLAMVSQADEAGQSLQEIVAGIATVSDMMTQISSATNQQAETTSQAANALESIAMIGEQAVQATQETANTVDDLSILAQNMLEITGRFNI